MNNKEAPDAGAGPSAPTSNIFNVRNRPDGHTTDSRGSYTLVVIFIYIDGATISYCCSEYDSVLQHIYQQLLR